MRKKKLRSLDWVFFCFCLQGGDAKKDVAMETASGSTHTPARHRHGSKSGRRSESQSSEGGGADKWTSIKYWCPSTLLHVIIALDT